MPQGVDVKCQKCGRLRYVLVPDGKDPQSCRYICTTEGCGGSGAIVERGPQKLRLCAICLKSNAETARPALPGSRFCTEHDVPPARREAEWGSRDAWRRDRASWKRPH